MKQSINLYQFRDAFRDMNRGDNFSYEGLGILFEWFEQYDEDSNSETELDVIALCCEFSESTVDEVIENYSIDTSSLEHLSDDDDKTELVIDYLTENTFFIGETSNGSLIYQEF